MLSLCHSPITPVGSILKPARGRLSREAVKKGKDEQRADETLKITIIILKYGTFNKEEVASKRIAEVPVNSSGTSNLRQVSRVNICIGLPSTLFVFYSKHITNIVRTVQL